MGQSISTKGQVWYLDFIIGGLIFMAALVVFFLLFAFALVAMGARRVVLGAPLAVLERERFTARWYPLSNARVEQLAEGRFFVLLLVKLCPLAIIIGSNPNLVPHSAALPA